MTFHNDLVLVIGVVFLETALLAGVVMLIDRFLPANMVQLRHDAARFTLFVVPALCLFPFVPIPAPSDPAAAFDASLNVTAWQSVSRNVTEAAEMLVPAVAPQAAPAMPGGIIFPSFPETIMFIWIAGAAFCFFRLAGDMIALGRLIRASQPETMPVGLSLTRTVLLRRSDRISSPMLAGFFRPVILMPAGDPVDPASRPVLEHEVAHMIRGDMWTTLFVRVLMAVFWWNLPMHAANRILRREREKLCDSYAVEQTGSPYQLADALLRTASRQVLARQPELSMAAATKGGGLAQRLHRLAEKDGTRLPRTRLAFLLMPSLAVLCLAAGPQGLAAQQPEQSRADFFERLERQDWLDWDDDEAQLYFAARRGNAEQVVALLDAGADPNQVWQGDGTALIGAVRSGQLSLVDLLLERGADPNIVALGDGSPLISAARVGRNDMIAMLLNAGADPNLGVRGDGLPLISAAHRGDIAIIDQLIAAGADVNLGIGGDGNALIAASLSGKTEAVKSLLAAGADPDGYVYGDETPLINAAQQGNIDVAEILVAAGADVSLTVVSRRPEHNLGKTEYRSALSEALRRQQEDMAAWLRDHGAEHRPQ